MGRAASVLSFSSEVGTMYRYIIPTAAVLVSFVIGGPARASMIQLLIDPVNGSTENTGSTATLTFDFTEQGPDDYLSVIIENTTSTAIGSSLTAVGFELPDVLSLPLAFAPGGTSAYFDELTYDVSVSPGWLNALNGYDVMITSDGDFLGGNPNGAPRAGESQTVILNLGDTGMTPSGLSDAFMNLYMARDGLHAIGRFQSVGPNGADSDKVGGRVPEPATLALLALGGLALQARRRRG
jgi:hypothetical protein